MTDKKKKLTTTLVTEPPKFMFKIMDQPWAVSLQIAQEITCDLIGPVVDQVQQNRIAGYIKPHGIRFMLSQQSNAVESTQIKSDHDTDSKFTKYEPEPPSCKADNICSYLKANKLDVMERKKIKVVEHYGSQQQQQKIPEALKLFFKKKLSNQTPTKKIINPEQLAVVNTVVDEKLDTGMLLTDYVNIVRDRKEKQDKKLKQQAEIIQKRFMLAENPQNSSTLHNTFKEALQTTTKKEDKDQKYFVQEGVKVPVLEVKTEKLPEMLANPFKQVSEGKVSKIYIMKQMLQSAIRKKKALENIIKKDVVEVPQEAGFMEKSEIDKQSTYSDLDPKKDEPQVNILEIVFDQEGCVKKQPGHNASVGLNDYVKMSLQETIQPTFGTNLYDGVKTLEEEEQNLYTINKKGPMFRQNPEISSRKMSIADYELQKKQNGLSLNQTTHVNKILFKEEKNDTANFTSNNMTASSVQTGIFSQRRRSYDIIIENIDHKRAKKLLVNKESPFQRVDQAFSPKATQKLPSLTIFNQQSGLIQQRSQSIQSSFNKTSRDYYEHQKKIVKPMITTGEISVFNFIGKTKTLEQKSNDEEKFRPKLPDLNMTNGSFFQKTQSTWLNK